MIRNILIPVNGSVHTIKAIDFVAEIAAESDIVVYFLNIVKTTKVPDGLIDYMRAEGINETPASVYQDFMGHQIVDSAKSEAIQRGINNIETSVFGGDPAQGIIDFAKENYIDMIILGSRGLGNVSSKVCRESDRTCVIVRQSLLDEKKILIVDDEPDILEILEDLLPMCNIITASDFKTAKTLLETQTFDLAILDIMGVDGYNLLTTANKKKVITVMLTANALSLEDTLKSYQEGAAAYIPKEKMANIEVYLNDVLEAKESGKHFWWRWLERFGAYYDKKFGSKFDLTLFQSKGRDEDQ
ncbi:universal stress protein [Thermodesulfobacteriota bacterium]